MLGKTYDSQVCSIARTLECVGERWSLLIVRDALFFGATRYNDFQRSLGIATNILKSRLDGLVQSGIMVHSNHGYELTDKGRALAPALVALTEWGDRWVTDIEPPMRYTHAECGEEITQQTVCAHCGEVGDPAEIKANLSPGVTPNQ